MKLEESLGSCVPLPTSFISSFVCSFIWMAAGCQVLKIIQKAKQTWLMFSKSLESVLACKSKFNGTTGTDVKWHQRSAICGALKTKVEHEVGKRRAVRWGARWCGERGIWCIRGSEQRPSWVRGHVSLVMRLERYSPGKDSPEMLKAKDMCVSSLPLLSKNNWDNELTEKYLFWKLMVSESFVPGHLSPYLSPLW